MVKNSGVIKARLIEVIYDSTIDDNDEPCIVLDYELTHEIY